MPSKTRRQLLGYVAGSSIFVLAGCVGDTDETEPTSSEERWSPSVVGGEPELSPGEETTLTVEATDVAGITLRLPYADAVTIEANDHDWSPPSDTAYDSYPQLWFWSSRVSVEGKFPVTTTVAAESGEYSYGVEVFADENPNAESVTENFTITVKEN